MLWGSVLVGLCCWCVIGVTQRIITPTLAASKLESIDSDGIVGWIECGGVVVGSTAGQSDKFDVQGSDGSDSAFLFRVDEATRVTFSTCNQNTNYDTKLQVVSVGSSNKFGFNDDAITSECGEKSILTVPLRPATYIVVVDGFRGASGSYEVAMSCESFVRSSSVTPSETPTHTLSQTQTSSQSQTPSQSPSQSSTRSRTQTSSQTASSASTTSSSPTQTPTQRSTESGTKSSAQTPSSSSTQTPSSSLTLTPSQTPSTTVSPSPSSSKNILQAFFLGGSPSGNQVGINRVSTVNNQFVFAIQFPVLRDSGTIFLMPCEKTPGETKDCLVNWSNDLLELYYNADLNCGQSSSEAPCSCKSTCGTASDLRCCNNFHRVTKTLIGDFVPVLQDADLSVRFRINCNNARITYLFFGIRANNTVFYDDSVLLKRFVLFEPTKWATEGAVVGAQGARIRYPHVPDHTVTNNAQAVNFCVPPNSAKVTDLSIDRTTSCENNCGFQSFGGCFCDTVSCTANNDCCNDVNVCV
eukprot:c20671_g2_i5.p1 GENE.c20671_g2_i5~~c20671_g2_i5.p1  ORF type:complete len:525 (+),score=100.57 c20671_g2_i5:60-1634(+)